MLLSSGKYPVIVKDQMYYTKIEQTWISKDMPKNV